jgi:hypothetical protein
MDESQLTRIEHKVDRILEFILANIPRPREEWPPRMSVRARRALALSKLTPPQVRAMGEHDAKYALLAIPNCGETTIDEIIRVAHQREVR